MLIVPVRVQGVGSADEIARAIATVNRLLTPDRRDRRRRGGGSLEDLWAFNEEAVVRAIAGSRIPVVSAVGHEIDVTLADLVADLRALTPSEAAERVVPAVDDIRAKLRGRQQQMVAALRNRVGDARRRLEALADRRVLRKPFDRLHELGQQLDQWSARAERAVRQRVARSQARRGHAFVSSRIAQPARRVVSGIHVDHASRRPIDRQRRGIGDRRTNPNSFCSRTSRQSDRKRRHQSDSKSGTLQVMNSPAVNPPSAAGPTAPPDFETALARMEAIVYELEEGRIGLAEALARYEEGVGLLRQCFGLLETAERRIELLTGIDAAGNPIVAPYDDTASAERAEQGTPRQPCSQHYNSQTRQSIANRFATACHRTID